MSHQPVQTMRLRLTCVYPPPASHNGQATEFGMLDRTGALTPGMRLPDGALRFDIEVQVARRSDGSANLGGSYVHGPPGGRFLYLGWRPIGGAWIRRTKVPLAAITWPLVEAAGDGTLDATVAGDRGATVPLLIAWHAPLHGPTADDGTG